MRRRLGVWVGKSLLAGVLSSFMLSATAVAAGAAVAHEFGTCPNEQFAQGFSVVFLIAVLMSWSHRRSRT